MDLLGRKTGIGYWPTCNDVLGGAAWILEADRTRNPASGTAAASKIPMKNATAGPTEKSKWYENSRPRMDAAPMATRPIIMRTPVRVAKRAEVVAGTINMVNATTTPMTGTANVITMPSNE
jgi:hypothetical protein